MINSFYTAATGAIELQKGFDVTANNIANVSTTGYKATSASFADLVYTNVHAAAGTEGALKTGHGAKLQKTDTVFTTGNQRPTGRSLDFSLADSNTFFAVQSGEDVRYTRNGNFHISVENGVDYLTTAEGGYVLSPDGARIVVGSEVEDFNIGIFSFSNQDGLVREGNTSFAISEASGEIRVATNAELKRGYLEDSTVDIASEMTTVIQLQRAFQMNSKMVTIADELMQTINSLR